MCKTGTHPFGGTRVTNFLFFSILSHKVFSAPNSMEKSGMSAVAVYVVLTCVHRLVHSMFIIFNPGSFGVLFFLVTQTLTITVPTGCIGLHGFTLSFLPPQPPSANGGIVCQADCRLAKDQYTSIIHLGELINPSCRKLFF